MVSDIVVEFKDVWFKYNDARGYVLKGINFIARRGEAIAIVGVNGVGKTTFIKHINGLLKPSKGVVKVLGMNTKVTPTSKIARHVGFVPQNPYHILFAETVRQELEFTLKNFGFPSSLIDERIRFVAEVLNIKELLDKSPFSLSGGELRKVVLAIALSYDPDIILLDEPTIGYDRRNKYQLIEIIKKLVQEGKTVIAASHDVDFVASAFNRIIVLSNGTIIANGTTRDILYDYKVMEMSNLLVPPIPNLFIKLEKYIELGNPYKPISVYEALDVLKRILGGNNGSGEHNKRSI